jgi:predicted dehydrogenase
MAEVRWGLLSTDAIGRTVVAADPGAFVAVASRDATKAAAFAASAGLTTSFGSYEELPASDTVDAVYVALPNTLHADWTTKVLRAITEGTPPAFGRDDAVAQATAYEALMNSATSGVPVTLR